MNSPLEQYFNQQGIDQELQDFLKSFSGEDAEALADFLGALQPSLNTLRELVRMSREICTRDSISLAMLIGRSEIEELAKTKMSRKQKALALRRELEAIRYPEKTRIHQEIDNAVAAIRRDLGVTLSLPQDFEGLKVSLSFEVQEAKGFLRASEICSGLAEHHEVQRLFALLRGEESDGE